jgi:hypothetical protein
VAGAWAYNLIRFTDKPLLPQERARIHLQLCWVKSSTF